MKRFTVTVYYFSEGVRTSKKAGVFSSKGLALRVAKEEAKALGGEAYIEGYEKTRTDKESRTIYEAAFSVEGGLTVY